MILRKKTFGLLFLASVVALTFLLSSPLYAEESPTSTPTPTTTPNVNEEKIKEEIKALESKVKDLRSQSQTLSSQISVMDNQIKLTELRINATEQELENLEYSIETASHKITNLETSLNSLTKILRNRIRVTYETGNVQPLELLLSSKDAKDFFAKENYLKIVQAHDKQLIYETQQARNDYVNQKDIFEQKKEKVELLQAQLEGYTRQLNKDKASKKTLLAETQGSEANYQRLLSQAKAQLAGFSRFVSSQGGASILSGQTKCDDWGCYYNQRDSQWGNSSLNGTQYTLASDGCLVTSMAMVYTHYGNKGVTPQTINSISSNFASYYPAYLNFAITADGRDSRRIGTSIDSSLSSGDPVVVGVNANGGTHFIVLVSGSNGNYLMHDPFVPNGYRIPFADHYSMGSIFSVQKVVF